MIISKLKELHPLIYKRILECQMEQNNIPNDTVLLSDEVHEGNFNWIDTEEGNDFWGEIDEERFDIFYEKYPQISYSIYH